MQHMYLCWYCCCAALQLLLNSKMFLRPPLTEARTLRFEVKSKTNNWICHSLARGNNGWNDVSRSSTHFQPHTKSRYSVFEKPAQRLLCPLTSPPQICQSFLCVVALWWIHWVMRPSDTRDIMSRCDARHVSGVGRRAVQGISEPQHNRHNA